MLKSNNKMSELQDLLDSDDELPTTYNEVPETPAYLNDSRFDAIQFSWLNSAQIRKCPKKKETILAPIQHSQESYGETSIRQSSPELYQEANTSTIQSTSETYQDKTTHTIQYLRKTCEKPNEQRDASKKKTLMKRGILKKEDILCMKSFAALTSDDATLLWFIDFLIFKDLQSDFKFLRSCLVSHQLPHEYPNKPNNLMQKNSVGNFEFIVV